MEDYIDIIENSVFDLVSSESSEGFVMRLLETRQAGQWARVQDLCRESGITVADVISASPDLFVTWLRDPLGDAGFVVITFFDDISKFSRSAHYNKSRLFNL